MNHRIRIPERVEQVLEQPVVESGTRVGMERSPVSPGDDGGDHDSNKSVVGPAGRRQFSEIQAVVSVTADRLLEPRQFQLAGNRVEDGEVVLASEFRLVGPLPVVDSGVVAGKAIVVLFKGGGSIETLVGIVVGVVGVELGLVIGIRFSSRCWLGFVVWHNSSQTDYSDSNSVSRFGRVVVFRVIGSRHQFEIIWSVVPPDLVLVVNIHTTYSVEAKLGNGEKAVVAKPVLVSQTEAMPPLVSLCGDAKVWRPCLQSISSVEVVLVHPPTDSGLRNVEPISKFVSGQMLVVIQFSQHFRVLVWFHGNGWVGWLEEGRGKRGRRGKGRTTGRDRSGWSDLGWEVPIKDRCPGWELLCGKKGSLTVQTVTAPLQQRNSTAQHRGPYRDSWDSLLCPNTERSEYPLSRLPHTTLILVLKCTHVLP